jgi:NAD(P)-dependent dehydrogenase (short-subunit alcohol dehydrogenase family)
LTGDLKFDTFKAGPTRTKLGKEALYLQSKFGVVVVAQELARRYGDQGVVTTSLNPGTLESNLYRHVDSPIQKAVAVSLWKVLVYTKQAKSQFYAETTAAAGRSRCSNTTLCRDSSGGSKFQRSGV